MDKKTEEFIRRRVEYMKILGLTDNESKTDDYIDMIRLSIQEQEDKNIISDSKIDYNDEIVEIEELGDMETVDISVTGDQLFYCNGILTKNSIGVASTADCIFSIFQNDEDQELGLIKLGIIKNRYGPRGMVQAMTIDYPTLTIRQSDEDEETFNDDDLGVLERLANN